MASNNPPYRGALVNAVKRIHSMSRDNHKLRERVIELEQKLAEHECVSYLGSAHAYLSDGMKLVVYRDNGNFRLKLEKQLTIRVQEAEGESNE